MNFKLPRDPTYATTVAWAMAYCIKYKIVQISNSLSPSTTLLQIVCTFTAIGIMVHSFFPRQSRNVDYQV